MKITLNQLKKIIKEEIENVDSVSSNDEYMSVDDLIEFARAYVAVPRELRKILILHKDIIMMKKMMVLGNLH